jgi:WD40 repeat protein
MSTGIDALADRRRVVAADQVCDAFEAAWRAGQRPRVEDCLGGAAGPERDALLAELIPLDAEYRRRHGEAPAPGDYAARFPHLDPVWLARLLRPGRDAAPEDTPAAPPAGCPACGAPTGAPRPADAGADRFELVQKVGAGASAVVWRARDRLLGRVVALKVPYPALVASPEAVERFHREARAAAQLRHPGIVTVHEVVTLDGLPALVEDFIDGEPLRDLLARRRPTPREAARLAAEVAEALDYAHRMGAVHRDVKPANIVVAADGNGPPRPLLLDFGLARNDGAEAALTLDGQLVGTPAYMSPEQAAGRGNRVDARTDVYSLGAVLYEMLTGQLPHRGGKAVLLERIQHDEVRPVRALNRKVPRDLETVCLKALARDPQRRYPTAARLAEDLRRFLRGEPVRARRVGAAERAFRWARRRPAAAALMAVSGLAAAALVVAAVSARYSAKMGEAIAETERARRAEAGQRTLAEAGLYRHRILLASHELTLGNVGRVEQLLEECTADRRGWEWHYLRGQCHADLLSLLSPPVRPGWWTVTSVAWSPDGRQLLSACKDGGVYIWDPSAGRPGRLLGTHPGGAMAAAWSPDGRLAATAGLDQAVRVWDVAAGAELHVLRGHFGHVYSVAFSPDGRALASGSGEWLERVDPDHPGRPEVRLWDVASGEELLSLPAGDLDVVGLAFRPGGRELAAAGGAWMAGGGGRRLGPGELTVWDCQTGEEVRRLRGHAGPLSGVAYTPDGGRLVTSSWDRTLRVWDADTGADLDMLRGHQDRVRGVAVSPDGARAASAGADGLVKVWDLRSGEELVTLRGHTQAVASVAFSPDGRRLASSGGDQMIKIWDPVREQGGARYARHSGPVVALSYSPDGRTVYSAAIPTRGDGPQAPEIHRWDAATGRLVRAYLGESAALNVLAVSPDGRLLAAGRVDGTVQVWDAASGEPKPGRPRHVGAVRCLAFTPDSKGLVSAALRRVPEGPAANSDVPWQMEVKVWDAQAGRELATLPDAAPVWPRSLAVHPRDGRVAVGDDKGMVRWWDLRTRQQAGIWPAHQRVASGLAFRADGHQLASVSWDGTARIWDLNGAGGAGAVRTFRGHARPVTCVAFSPDGGRLVTGGEDRAVKVWDADSGWEILTLTGHADTVTAVAFSPGGRQLASASLDGTVKVWQAEEEPPRR